MPDFSQMSDEQLESLLARATQKKQKMMATPTLSSTGGVGFDFYNPEVERQKLELKASIPSAGERSKLAEKEQYGSRINKMIDLFKSSYPASREKTLMGQYGKKIPLFGESAAYDRAIGAELSGKIPVPFTRGISIGRLPAGAYPREDTDWSKMAAYEDMAEGFLTTLAKQAGEQRPTDQDVERFRKSLMGYGKDPGTNQILMDSLTKDASTLSPKEFLGKYTGNPVYSSQRKFGQQEESTSIPQVGQTFQGGKVKKVTRVS